MNAGPEHERPEKAQRLKGAGHLFSINFYRKIR
jgi:hypothetical protein